LANGLVAVPFDGFVFRWRLVLSTSGGSHLYKLRIIRPAGGGMYTGAGTGPPQQATSAGLNLLTLPEPMPVKAGDLIGFDCEAMAPIARASGVATGSTYTFFSGPTLADNGMPRTPTNSAPNLEMLVNADVAVKPSNVFSFGAVRRQKKKGTARLAVVVPAPGTLVLGGTGVGAQQAGHRARKTVSAAGTVDLLIKPSGKAKRKLKQSGKATVTPSVTYTPFLDISGDPNTQSTKVKLIRK
jgi:hypothetical protein